METISKQIRQQLRQNSDSHTKASGQKFFKESVRVLGVKTAVVSKIAKTFNKEIKAMEKKQVFDLCEELWQSGYLEESFVACHYSYLISNKYLPSDFGILEK